MVIQFIEFHIMIFSILLFRKNLQVFNGNLEALSKKIESFKGLTALDFGTPWSTECKKLDTVLPSLADKNTDVLFLLINVDQKTEFVDVFKIYNIPDVRFYYRNFTEIGQCSETSGPKLQTKIDEMKKLVKISEQNEL